MAKPKVDPSQNSDGNYWGDNPDNQPDEWQKRFVDLVALEENVLKGRKVYTGERLREISRIRNKILSNNSLPLQKIRDVEDQWRVIWEHVNEDDDSVNVHYMSFVELDPYFHKKGSRSKHTRALHNMNEEGKDTGDEQILCPIYLQSYDSKVQKRDHITNQKVTIAEWRKTVSLISEFWESSRAWNHIRTLLRTAASKTAQIKNIVGFGLGSMVQEQYRDGDKYQALLEHLTAFSIASELATIYQAQDPTTPPIKVVLQDPGYTETDGTLLREVFPFSTDDLIFVSDPDGHSYVNPHSLVMAAYLPLVFPLVQVLADMPNPPAAFLGDAMKLDPKKRLYRGVDRATPRVVTWLSKYGKSNFDDVKVENDLFHKTSLGMFWLWDMNLWLKPKPKPEPEPKPLKFESKTILGVLSDAEA
jgi:hypothetical protein